MDIFLQRIGYTPFGVLGILTVGNKVFKTIEQPWNASNEFPSGILGKSCVPDGTYQLMQHDTPDHPHTVAMVAPALGVYHNPGDVPEDQKPWARTDCLIHNANFARQVQGCIAIGEEHSIGEDVAGDKQYQLDVTNSEKALEEFQEAISGAPSLRLFIRPTTGAIFAGIRNLN